MTDSSSPYKHFAVSKPYMDFCAAFEANIPLNKLGIIHMHDVKQTLRSKGAEIAAEARVYEICNPVRAKHLLDTNMQILTALPCRVSVWQAPDGTAEVGLIDAQANVGFITQDPEILAYVTEVNEMILKAVHDSISA